MFSSDTWENLQSAGSNLFSVLVFLEALVNSDRGGDGDGRLLVTPITELVSACGLIRFVILNPGRYLQGGFESKHVNSIFSL